MRTNSSTFLQQGVAIEVVRTDEKGCVSSIASSALMDEYLRMEGASPDANGPDIVRHTAHRSNRFSCRVS